MPSPSAVSVFKTSLLTHSLISTLDFYPDSNQTGSRVPINTQSRQSLSSGSSFDLTEVDSQHGESLSSVEEDRVSLPSVISARSNNASPHLPELDEEILNLLEQSRIKVFGPAPASTPVIGTTTTSSAVPTSSTTVVSLPSAYPPIVPIIAATPTSGGVSQTPLSTITIAETTSSASTVASASTAMLLLHHHHQQQQQHHHHHTTAHQQLLFGL